jgi:hypothetical protein
MKMKSDMYQVTSGRVTGAGSQALNLRRRSSTALPQKKRCRAKGAKVRDGKELFSFVRFADFARKKDGGAAAPPYHVRPHPGPLPQERGKGATPYQLQIRREN